MREALAALVALVGLLPRVQARVLDQVVLVFERFFANLTLVWSFSCKGRTRGQTWVTMAGMGSFSTPRSRSNATAEPPRCRLFKGSSVAETEQNNNKNPTHISVTSYTLDAFDCSNFTQAAQDNKENDSESINGKLAALASS